MADLAAIIAAVFARIAAVVSVGTFWFTQRREERVWRRESMIDSLVLFIGASFSGVGRRAMEAKERGESLTAFEEQWDCPGFS